MSPQLPLPSYKKHPIMPVSSFLEMKMMFTVTLRLLYLLLLSGLASSLAHFKGRQTARLDESVHCGQWDTVTAGPYELLLDQWGASGATSGSQCAHLISLNNSTDVISWSTNWTWVGGSGVKSFTNIQLNQNIGKQLQDISSMPVRNLRRSYTKSSRVLTSFEYHSSFP